MSKGTSTAATMVVRLGPTTEKVINMMCCGAGMMGWMGLMGLFWLVLIAGGVAVVIWAIIRRPGGERDRAQAILRERFARGEISEEDYQQRRRLLDAE
jgi:putative membrane protein